MFIPPTLIKRKFLLKVVDSISSFDIVESKLKLVKERYQLVIKG